MKTIDHKNADERHCSCVGSVVNVFKPLSKVILSQTRPKGSTKLVSSGARLKVLLKYNLEMMGC